MKLLTSAYTVFGLLSLTHLLTLAQDSSRPKHIADADVSRRQAIKDEFTRNWNSYTKLASGFDKLSPIRGGGYDDDILGGFQGTVIESLSTMIVLGMGESAEYKRMLEIVKKIDFSQTKKGNPVGTLSLFEFTIRYIGGLLSAYQLNGEKKEEEFLVAKAKMLADEFLVAWQGTNKVPYNWININLKKPNNLADLGNLAEAGTLAMEWTMLSKYTNDPKYAKLAQGSVDAIISTPGYFPSVWPSHFEIASLKPASTYISTGGGTDSFIEYLLKFPVLVDQKDHRFAQTYGKMIDTFRKELVSKTSSRNLTFIADYDISKKQVSYVGSHLACFLGGNIAYAGRLYNRDDYVQLGLEVTESCYETYKSSATGIGPYSIGWFDQNGKTNWEKVPTGRREFANEHGFFMNIMQWLHHPEVLESIFYAHRITGNPVWRDMAWEAFLNIKKYADANGVAIAGIQNVNDLNTPLFDQTETYFYSETLKYLYLIFSEANDYSLDEFVFTTEGHIFKRGSGALPVAKSKRAASTTTTSPSNNWGKVQGIPFQYKSIVDAAPLKTNALNLVKSASTGGAAGESDGKIGARSGTGSIMIDIHADDHKQNAFFAPPSATKKELIDSTMSLLGVSPEVAHSMLSRCAKDNSRVVNTKGAINVNKNNSPVQ